MTRIPEALRRLQSMPAVTPDTSRILSHPLRPATSFQEVSEAARGRAAPPQATPLAQVAWDSMSTRSADEGSLQGTRGDYVYDKHRGTFLERLGDVRRCVVVPDNLADVDLAGHDDQKFCESLVYHVIENNPPEDVATHISLQKHLITLKCCRALIARLHQGQDTGLLQNWRAENMPAADLRSQFRACLATTLAGDQTLTASFELYLQESALQQADEVTRAGIVSDVRQGLWQVAIQQGAGGVERILDFAAAHGIDAGGEIIGQSEDNTAGPLHYAAMTGNAAVVRSLLDRAEPEDIPLLMRQRDTEGDTPLFMAANRQHAIDDEVDGQINHLETLETLLSRIPMGHKADVAGQRNVEGQTLIHALLLSDDGAAMQIALNAVPVNERVDVLSRENDRGDTALHVACYRGNAAMLGIMLDSVQQDERSTLVTRLSSGHHQDAPLHGAAQLGDAEVVRTVHTRILDGNQRLSIATQSDPQFKSPLYLAADKGHGETVRALLDMIPEDRRFDASTMPGPFGQCPIPRAAFKGRADVIRAFSEQITNPIERRQLFLEPAMGDFRTPLYHAVLGSLNPVDVARALLDAMPANERWNAIRRNDAPNQSPLSIAERGDNQPLKDLLRQYPQAI